MTGANLRIQSVKLTRLHFGDVVLAEVRQVLVELLDPVVGDLDLQLLAIFASLSSSIFSLSWRDPLLSWHEAIIECGSIHSSTIGVHLYHISIVEMRFHLSAS
ncbi:hypothetical protein CRG98_022196 [Punica granatum]|uniref:Uncharacterized protein n=1 Tax=Punica granatum TaxID=22663 RepID=A0A2I0JM54_PUNGR|nr:hypothetical protein CRG98_022196 [Punica granatum]